MYVFAEVELSTMLFLAALVLIIGTLLIRLYRYQTRQKEPASPIVRTRRRQSEDRGHYLGAPEAEMHWEVQMHETARDLSAQLDSKVSALAHLIRDADRAAGRLEAALEASRRHGDAMSVSSDPSSPATESPQQSDHSGTGPANQAEALKSAGPADPQSDSTAAKEADTSESPPGRRPHEEIYTLADYGFDTADIASRVGCPVGEVELILSLRAQREKESTNGQ